jgi:hypothetical protein
LSAAGQSGGLAGRVIDSSGRALAGVCVAASPVRIPGRSQGAGRIVVTSADGTFMMADLPAGAYLLRYRNCLTSTGSFARSPLAALGPGPLITSATSSAGYVTGGRVTALGPVTVRPWAAGQAAEMPARPAVTRLTAAQLRRHVKRQDLGGVAGTVLGPHGRHIKDLCFTVSAPGPGFASSIPADGRYNTGKRLPPGKYKAEFQACGFPFGTASMNWAPQWYRDKFSQSAANTVVVKAGKITRGIGGAMRRGGVISGTVTGPNGRAIRGICVVVATPKRDFVQQVNTFRSGRYQFQGLDPGRYAVVFFPCGPGSPYLPQWWPGTANETRRGLITTGFGTTRRHIDARMVVGGTISGVVRFRNRHGHPIQGICVNATPVSQPDSGGYLVATNAKGKYAFRGLPAGRYSLFFGPGCNNNGNYLYQNYPHNVTARLGHVTGGINAYLQPGAIITGTVTAKSSGAKLGGICVLTANQLMVTLTKANGSYSMDQLPPGRTKIEFVNCQNRGNFAPQFYPGNLNVAGAESVAARPGRVTSGIDAALEPGATISGTIALSSGRKLSQVCAGAAPVQFATDVGGRVALSRQGRYTIEDLAPGDYQVEYISCGGPSIGNTWFRSPGSVTANEANADQLYVPSGGSVPGIDAVLQAGGYISGWIFGPASQRGSFVCVAIGHSRNESLSNDFFPLGVGDGYTIFGFTPGKYFVEFVPCGGENLAFQWYKRASRPAKARPVLVRAGHTTSNVDAWMTAGGSITGRVVSKTSGKPLRGVCVFADSVNQAFYGFTTTDRTGHYVVAGLNTSTYRLSLNSCEGGSNLVPLVTGRMRAVQGKTVAAPAVAMRTFVGGEISGRVTIAGSRRRPAIGSCVEVSPLSQYGSSQFGFGTTGPRGYYLITNLIPGKYRVFIDPSCDPGGLVPQWYKDASRISKATVVTVAAGQRTRSISVVLQPYGAISGTVTGPAPADKALAGICVQAVPVQPGAAPFLTESTGPNGSYQTGPLPPGKYLVEFEADCATRGYRTQWWQGSASMIYATPVTVSPGLTHSGIDAHMTQVPRKDSTGQGT